MWWSSLCGKTGLTKVFTESESAVAEGLKDHSLNMTKHFSGKPQPALCTTHES